jgi:adenosine deaminase
MNDLKQIVIAGFKSAFLPFHVKQNFLRRVTEELKAFADDAPAESTPVLMNPPSTTHVTTGQA